jgi:hypothetical protein
MSLSSESSLFVETRRIGILLDCDSLNIVFCDDSNGIRFEKDIPPGFKFANPYISMEKNCHGFFYFSPELWKSSVQLESALLESISYPNSYQDWKHLRHPIIQKSIREDVIPFEKVIMCASQSSGLYDVVKASYSSVKLSSFEFCTKFQMLLLGNFVLEERTVINFTHKDTVHSDLLIKHGVDEILKNLLQAHELLLLLSFQELWKHFVVWTQGDLLKPLNICERFMSVVRMPEDSIEQRKLKYQVLDKLFTSFYEDAEKIAHTIALDLGNPPEKQTHKPASLGGIAGGKKYIVK